MSISRDDILAAAPPSEEVPVPQLGGKVRIRGMTGAERDAYEAAQVAMRGEHTELRLRNFRAKLVVRCVLNDDGTRMFTDKDADALGEVRGDLVDLLFSHARRLSGMTEGAVKKAEGNS